MDSNLCPYRFRGSLSLSRLLIAFAAIEIPHPGSKQPEIRDSEKDLLSSLNLLLLLRYRFFSALAVLSC
jgi:hypothetical protein